jgi:hypothetical protein
MTPSSELRRQARAGSVQSERERRCREVPEPPCSGVHQVGLNQSFFDLAMMEPGKALFRLGAAKATKAYAKSIASDLAKAIEALRARPVRLDRCLEALQMSSVPKALLWRRIKALKDLGA